MAVPLIEVLAELEHEQWIEWSKSIIASEPGISAERRARWEGYSVGYQDLSEEVKEHDRVWARRVLEAARDRLIDEASGRVQSVVAPAVGSVEATAGFDGDTAPAYIAGFTDALAAALDAVRAANAHNRQTSGVTAGDLPPSG